MSSTMDGADLDGLRQWAARWLKAGPALERVQARELAAVDVPKAILLLEDAFLSALRHSPPRLSSGLVQQQRWFARLKA